MSDPQSHSEAAPLLERRERLRGLKRSVRRTRIIFFVLAGLEMVGAVLWFGGFLGG